MSASSNIYGAAPLAPIKIKTQYVKNLIVDVLEGTKTFVRESPNPAVAVNIDVQSTPLENDEDIFDVTIFVKVEYKAPDDRTLFRVVLAYCGAFEIKLSPDMRSAVLMVECPRLLFPFARQVIASTTQQSGFSPLYLAPIDFVALFQSKNADNAADMVTH